MRVSRQEAEDNRARVVSKASELLRENGFDGIGIADLMKAAGLTHGGFYGQFASKQDLAAEAARQAIAQNATLWKTTIEAGGSDPLSALADLYLSRANLLSKSQGCTFAALGADASRLGEPVQSVFAEGIDNHLALLTGLMDGETDDEKRRKAIVVLSQMVGALTLARAVGDTPFAEEILTSVRDAIKPAL